MRSDANSIKIRPKPDIVARLRVFSRHLIICHSEAAMKFNITIDRDEDAVWISECPSIPGCVSQGKTKEEAIENIKDAIALCLEVRAEKGLPLTIETQQVEVAA